MKNWIVFGSQTFTEVNCIRKALGKDPDLIITNRTNLIGVNDEILVECKDKFVFLPAKPSWDDYRKVFKKYSPLFENCVVTLNGYLRILLPEVCSFFKEKKITCLNGHPGYLPKYPWLVGKDPQKRAYEAGCPTAGSIIHEVVAEVDAGRLLASKEISIEGMTLDEVYEALHNNSINLWIEYLRGIL